MAGLLIDGGYPNWLWYLSFVLGLASAATFVALQGVDRQRRVTAAEAVGASGSEA
jgi:hypothetical protein